MRYHKNRKSAPICPEEDCKFLNFWHRWGPHFDLAGGLACLSMLASIIYFGIGFYKDQTALARDYYRQRPQIWLTRARLDRLDGNIQLLMLNQHLTPLEKTSSEIDLENMAVSQHKFIENPGADGD